MAGFNHKATIGNCTLPSMDTPLLPYRIDVRSGRLSIPIGHGRSRMVPNRRVSSQMQDLLNNLCIENRNVIQ